MELSQPTIFFNLTSSSVNLSLVGTAFADTLTGGAGNDTLMGNAGDDSLDGGANNDYLLGGDGNDSILGGLGDDTIIGGEGADSLDGGEGSDIYIIQTFSEVAGVPHFVTDSGSIGIDEIRVFSANGTFSFNFSTEVGIEKIVMGTGLLAQADKSDVSPIWINARLDYGVAIEGNAGDNQVGGTLFNDSIAGGDGNDFLAGRAGDDSIQGGSGADNILGGLGSDTLSGGDGNDGFLFYSIFDTVVGVGRDQITDYNPLFDAISLSAIDADVTISGDQAFNFIGNNVAFSNTAGQLRFDSVTHILSGDVNGDATADFEIALIGITSISVTNSFNIF